MPDTADSTARDLASLTASWLLFLTSFRRNVQAMPADTAWVHRRLDAMMADMEQAVVGDPKLSHRLREAQYPLVYMADEVLLNCGWSGEPEWLKDPYEARRFKTSVRGRDFFDRMQAPDLHDREVLELYLTCLNLGFRGQFVKRPLQLREARERLIARLDLKRPTGHRFCREAYEVDSRNFVKLPAVATARIAAVTLGVVVAAWVIAKVSFKSSLEDLGEQTRAILAEPLSR